MTNLTTGMVEELKTALNIINLNRRKHDLMSKQIATHWLKHVRKRMKEMESMGFDLYLWPKVFNSKIKFTCLEKMNN